MILVTTASSVVVALAIAFSLPLVLVRKKDLFGFQLQLLYLFTDLGEALLSVVVVEGCHVGEGVGQAKVLNRWRWAGAAGAPVRPCFSVGYSVFGGPAPGSRRSSILGRNFA